MSNEAEKTATDSVNSIDWFDERLAMAEDEMSKIIKRVISKHTGLAITTETKKALKTDLVHELNEWIGPPFEEVIDIERVENSINVKISSNVKHEDRRNET